MSAPAKPPDSAMIPWSQVAVPGDPIFNAEWYIPIIRALNRRLKAINAMPIAEDALTYTRDGALWPWSTGPVELPLATGEDHGPALPFGEANPTLWGFYAAAGDTVAAPVIAPGSANVAGPGYGQLIPGDPGGYFLAPTMLNFQDIVGTSPGIVLGGFGDTSWRPLTQWKVQSFNPATGQITYLPISGQTEDPLDPIQYPPATPIASSSILTTLFNYPEWTPSPGDIINVLDKHGADVARAAGAGVVYPSDFKAIGFSYKAFYAIVVNLLCYFVDASIDWAGKTKADLQALCQNHQDWMNQISGGNFAPSWFPPTAHPFFNFNQIRPLFQTAWPCWPPRTPPAGYPAGRPFGGFTRLREREITSIGDAGSEGQIARFIYSLSGQYEDGQTIFSYDDPSQFFGPAWTVPASMPHPITPADQLKHATKVMLYHEGAWAEHPDQTTLPDILTFYGTPKPGDIIGVHNVNELRAAISLLTDSISDEYVRWGYAQDSSGTQSGDKSAANGSDASNYGHTATAATTTAAYNAPPNPSYGSGREVFSWTMAGNDLSGPYFACASQAAKLNIYSLAHGMTRDVRFWMFTAPIPGVPLADYTFDNSGLAFATYSTYPDAAGTGTDAGQIVLAGTTTGATADHVDLAGYVGSLPQWLPSFPATPSVGSPDQYRGIYLYPLVATCHWTFND